MTKITWHLLFGIKKKLHTPPRPERKKVTEAIAPNQFHPAPCHINNERSLRAWEFKVRPNTVQTLTAHIGLSLKLCLTRSSAPLVWWDGVWSFQGLPDFKRPSSKTPGSRGLVGSVDQPFVDRSLKLPGTPWPVAVQTESVHQKKNVPVQGFCAE